MDKIRKVKYGCEFKRIRNKGAFPLRSHDFFNGAKYMVLIILGVKFKR